MLQSITGVYKNGSIKLTETPDLEESQVIVTFLKAKPQKNTKQNIRFGMFSGSNQSNEENFTACDRPFWIIRAIAKKPKLKKVKRENSC